MDVILIPGLGKNHNERMFLWLKPLWRLYGVRLLVCEINWEDGQAFGPKLEHLKAEVAMSRNLIGIVGASAGASAAVHLLKQLPDQVPAVVTVCGLLESNYLDAKLMQRRSPAFLEAMTAATVYLEDDQKLAAKMMTIRPHRDRIVDPSVATTRGACDVRLGISGHAFSIGYILTFKVALIKQFLLSKNPPTG